MRKIVICPSQMHKNLLAKYRQKDVFSDVKTITKEELLREFYGKVEKGTIPFLMKKYGYSYDNCKALIRIIPFVDKSKGDLFKIKEEMIDNHLLVKNEYLKTFLSSNEISIVGYSTFDKEIKGVLDHFGVSYQFFNNNRDNSGLPLQTFETEFNEVFYTLNEIASLIDQGIDINKIYIYLQNDEYLYYIKKFTSGFGFNTDLDDSFPLYFSPMAKKFLNAYEDSRDYQQSKEVLNDCDDQKLKEEILKVIDESYDLEMSYEVQLDYLLGELKSTRYQQLRFTDVVKVINKPIYEETSHIFVLGFAQGQYPKSFKDNGLLSDEYKNKLGLNTSIDETKNNEEELIDFFKSDNYFHFSFSFRSIANQYFISPLAGKLCLKENKASLKDTFYSQDMANYLFTKLKDLKEFYNEESSDYYALEKIAKTSYGSYDNSFTGVNALNHDMNMRYSYSIINDYYKCPFKYYLSNVLKIDPFEGNFYTKLGSVAHKVFELQNEADFDFDKVFNQEAERQQFLPEEMPLLENVKIQIKKASDVIRLHNRSMINPKFITEAKFTYSFGKHSFLVGVIDKTIILDDKYLAIVDYKTGNDSFDSSHLEDGVSLQLPTYCLLIHNDDRFKDYQIIGTFINNVINTKLSYKRNPEASIDPFYRLNGKVLADKEVISYLDNTISNGKSEFIKAVNLKKDGGFKESNSLAGKEDFDYYSEIALRKYLEADNQIRENNFAINPLYISDRDNACLYCQYRDICYVRSNQRRYLSNTNPNESEEISDE